MTVTPPVVRTVDECFARIDAYDASIRAMVHIDREGAIKAAEASAARWAAMSPISPIDGMPVAIKANIAVEDWPWTAGIGAFADRRARSDATCVRLLRAAGAVLVGLTNMDEGGLGAVTDNRWFGRTHNPHRPGFTAGGSSGGSAAAVAAGFCVAALGTDTIGSIRIPAAYCGVVGHKPQRGLIRNDGLIPLSPTLDHIGIIARTADTCAMATQVMEETAPSDVERLAGKSIAVLDWPDAQTLSADIRAAFDIMVEAARRAHMVIERVPPEIFPFVRAQRLLFVIAEIEGAAVHRDTLRERPEGFSPAFSELLTWGAGARSTRYEPALHELQAMTTTTRKALAGFDAILMPATPRTAFAFDAAIPRDQALFATLASSLGTPATVFPIGVSEDGLPIAAQVVAQRAEVCLAIAGALTA